ncbi:MAG TPA: DUF4288 domain-containing protein [Candidatus Eremiobacteraceae bacterium]|jgi:hypothetical protein|nr:DUF4288 domain-containing protein [Candidatus Eremiobacteraceae bacterium]
MWYAAHLITTLRAKRDEGDADEDPARPLQAWEDVILVDAADPDEAIRKATEFGTREAAEDSKDLVIDDKPAAYEFVGVRKLGEIGEKVTGHEQAPSIIEVTTTEIEVRNGFDLLQLARGGEVLLRYVT